MTSWQMRSSEFCHHLSLHSEFTELGNHGFSALGGASWGFTWIPRQGCHSDSIDSNSAVTWFLARTATSPSTCTSIVPVDPWFRVSPSTTPCRSKLSWAEWLGIFWAASFRCAVVRAVQLWSLPRWGISSRQSSPSMLVWRPDSCRNLARFHGKISSGYIATCGGDYHAGPLVPITKSIKIPLHPQLKNKPPCVRPTGLAASMASFLLAAGEKGKRTLPGWLGLINIDKRSEFIMDNIWQYNSGTIQSGLSIMVISFIPI